MAYKLEDFCADIRETYDDSGNADLEQVRQLLEKFLQNTAYVEKVCGPNAEFGTHILFHDPDFDFQVLAHNNEKGRTSPPHDHGASWAIYGQAKKFTDMTEYDRKDDGSKEGYAEVAVRTKYRLEPGMAGKFGPHEIHSIHFPDNGRFIRVTGTDLSKLDTLRYNMAEKSVTAVQSTTSGDAAGSASA